MVGIGARLFGIETEYGIAVEGRGAHDLMEESRRLVQAYPGIAAGPWDYRAESPRADVRGFQVEALNYNREDAALDRGVTISAEEQRSDRALANGARLYNDHGHPEYSTPECATLRDLAAHDRAGQEIVLDCARRRSETTGREVRLFKNNTDFHGISYGCHEGYLMERKVPFERLLHGLLPFLVTRILYAGAGKTGVESDGPFKNECQFQLSQRADFFTEIASVDTLARRPIVNTRDEPHADAARYRRLHVICGDANMSEFATALKVGVTCLVLDLLESGWEPLFRLKDPIAAFRAVSRDPAYRWLVELEDGRTMRATDLQWIYLRDAQRLLAGADGETAWVLREWERVLRDLETDPSQAADRVDWVAKRQLLETYIEAEGLWWENDALRSLDLEYHNLEPEEGLYFALEEAGAMERVVDDAAVRAALTTPPDTRAALRGELVKTWGPAIERISWGRVALRTGSGTEWLDLPTEFPRAQALRLAVAQAKTTQDVVRAFRETSAGS